MSSSPRLGRSGSGSGRYSSMQVPVSDVPLNPTPKPERMMFRSGSSLDPDAQDTEAFGGGRPGMLSRKSSLAYDRQASRYGGRSYDSDEYGSGDDSEEEDEDDGDGRGTGSMSLMALLAETDRELGLDESSYMMASDDEDDEEVVGRDEFSTCCVCMVRHKGDAFTACGHSYCRLCSRELLLERGTCPLCNNFIMEILPIF